MWFGPRVENEHEARNYVAFVPGFAKLRHGREAIRPGASLEQDVNGVYH